MSNLIPPLLSDTPPPPPDIDDHEEDEFGDFTGINNLSYDCEESYSPPGSPLQLPLHLPKDSFELDEPEPVKSFDENCNNKENLEEPVQLDNSKDFHDKRKGSDTLELTLNDSENLQQNNTTFQPSCDRKTSTSLKSSDDETLDSKIVIDLLETGTTETEVTTHNDEFNNFATAIIDNNESLENLSVAVSEELTIENCNIAEDPAQILPNSVSKETSVKDRGQELSEEEEIESLENLATSPENQHENFDDFSDFTSANVVPAETEIKALSDDFANFESFAPLPVITNTTFDDNDDDFGDFATTTTLTTSEPETKIVLLNDKQAFEKTSEIIKEMFPSVGQTQTDFELKSLEAGDKIFNQIKNITDTHALSYQWTKSASQNLLLKALNIDSRNILYGSGWNSAMPRFAANLSLTPLEPVKSEILSPIPVKSIEPPCTTKPDIMDTSKPETSEAITSKEDPKEVASELEILQPSKVELEQKVVKQDDFDDFVSYLPATSAAPSVPSAISRNVLLKETHISNNKEPTADQDIVSWLEPTIVTPELTRKSAVAYAETEEEFDDFHMVVVPEDQAKNAITTLTVKPLETQNGVVPKNATDDDFGDFTYSLPPKSEKPPATTLLEPLKPAVLPTPGVPHTISWPEPGITDDEISRLETYSRIHASKEEWTPTIVNVTKKATEPEEEWSDFVSVQNPSPVHKFKKAERERSSTPDLPLSVLNLGTVQPTKQPIPVITPNGLVQTKLSSNSSLNFSKSHQITNKVFPQQFVGSAPPPSIISNQYASQAYGGFNSYKPPPSSTLPQSAEDDEWSDFVSHQPSTTTQKPAAVPPSNYSWASSESGHNKVSGVNNKSSGVPNVLLPDLDFFGPKSRTTQRK